METVFDLKHPAFRAACRLTESAPRAAERRYLMEGAEQIQKALHAPLRPLQVFIKEDTEPALTQACAAQQIPVYSVAKGLFHRLLTGRYETSVTTVAVMPMWQVGMDDFCRDAQGIVVVAEQVQDPRNMGMLIRTADGAQTRALVLVTPCADPYSRACVRSTTGSIAFLPIISCDSSEEVAKGFRQHGWRHIGSSAHAERIVWEAGLTPPLCLWVGNEERGLLPETRQLMDEMIRIPIGGGAQSLNVAVASGVLLFEIARRLYSSQR